eukprot:1062389-Pleurochrysis_carterae.AAC.2
MEARALARARSLPCFSVSHSLFSSSALAVSHPPAAHALSLTIALHKHLARSLAQLVPATEFGWMLSTPGKDDV